MACKNCKDDEQIPQQGKDELAFAFAERMVKRLLIALVVTIVLLFASSAIFIYSWLQYDYSSEEIVTVDGKDGIANYIGNDGDIVNGESYGSEAEETNP